MQIVIWNNLDQAAKKIVLNRGTSPVENTVTNDVRTIVNTVRQQGDAALKEYTARFDHIQLQELTLAPAAWRAVNRLDRKIKQAIEGAYDNIKYFHQLQIPAVTTLNKNGVELWRQYYPLERVGFYIPGGTTPLISTLLMLAIPALLAGCKQIIVTTPPPIHPALLYVAKRCGITQIYSVGGAQAIAALAYGTESIPKVSKIFGPGNKYVTEAKWQVAQDPQGASLDMPAGPSEVLVIADAMANASLVAADLLAQQEHDRDAKAILVTTSSVLAEKVLVEIEQQTRPLTRQAILAQSAFNGVVIIASDLMQAVTIANDYAPEHLLLQIEQPRIVLPHIRHAGSVFIGPWSAKALGNYASGTNQGLTAYGYAKNYGGLCVESFMKSITFQEVSAGGLLKLTLTVETLADLEGLDAHKMSVLLRRKRLEKPSEWLN